MCVIRGYYGVLFLLVISQPLTLAQVTTPKALTKDDIDFRKEVYESKTKDRMPYRLFVPTGYDAGRKYPLVVWLHGTSGRGDDDLRQITQKDQLGSHFWISREAQAQFPAFVFAPQCPSRQSWAEPDFNQPSMWLILAMEALTNVRKQFSIDPDRVYLVGQSMGGLAVYSVLQNYRGKWAGAIVISAYDTLTDVPAIAEVSLWVFQGEFDSSVPVTTVRSIVAQLKKAHAHVRYTEYRQTDQGVENRAFAEPGLLAWLSAQKRGEPAGSQVGSGAAPSSR
jgi:predicted peptidase